MQYFTTRLLTLCFSLTAFYAFSQVPNDECSGAIPLILGQDSVVCDVNGSTSLATVSTYPAQCCGGSLNNDVWYSFTATSAYQTIALYNITPSYNIGLAYAKVEIFSGNCNSLQLVKQRFYYTGGNIDLTGLAVGQPYFIRVYGYDYYHVIDFDICLSETVPPANDECENATTVVPDVSQYPFTYNLLSTRGATQSLPPCGTGSRADDVWYTFTATSPSHVMLAYTGGGGDTIQYEIFGGACNNLASVKCGKLYANREFYIQGLTPGETYYVRFYTNFSYYSDYYITFFTLPPPPANDDCADALPLSVGTAQECNPETVITYGATSDLTSCSGAPVHDLWYNVTATSEQIIFEALNPSGSSGAYYNHYGLELYSGTCGQLTSLACVENSGYLRATGLTVGETYRLRVFSAENLGHILQVCARAVPPPPANVSCGSSVTLTLNSNQSCDVTTHGTTLSAPYSEGCYPPGASVWYNFTPTSGSVILSFLNKQSELYSSDLHFELYRGDCGDSLTLITCENVFEQPKIFTELVPGDIYYLKVTSPFYAGAGFDICLQTVDLPANDNCATATPLDIQPGMECTTPLPSGFYGATVSAPGDCQYRAEVWYSFTATQNAHTLNISNVIPVFPWIYFVNYSYALYGGSCNNLQVITCENEFSGNQVSLGDLTPGETYYLAIAPGPNSGMFTFDICLLTPPSPPANDACAGATPLQVNTGLNCDLFTAGTTENGTKSPVGFSTCSSANDDVWYSFVATQANHQLVFNNITDPVYFYYTILSANVYSGNCQSLTPINSFCNTYSGTSLLLSNLTPGDTYYVKVASVYNLPGLYLTFDLCVTSPPPPANDDCANAAPLTANEDLSCTYLTEGNTYGSTPSGVAGCSQPTANDLWYSFEATGSVYRVDMNHTGYQSDIGFQLLTGDCSNPVTVFCRAAYNYSPATFTNLTPGQTYYLRVFTNPGVPQFFSLCLRKLPDVPANDDCAQATPVTPNEDLTCSISYNGTTLSASSQDTSTCLGVSADVWYTFTASESLYVVDLRNVQSAFGLSSNVAVEIMSGSCGTLTSRQCLSSAYGASLIETIPGETYFIRVANLYSQDAVSFTLCLKTVPPPPTNLTCFTAQEIVSNNGQNCDVTYPASTTGQVTPLSYGVCSVGNDIWYHFTATASVHILQLQNLVSVYGNSSYMNVELYQGDDCLDINFLTCFAPFTNPQTISGLTPGTSYYLRLFSETGIGAIFDLCLQSVPPPDNDLCSGAIALSVNPDMNCSAPTAGTNYGAGQTPGTFCTDGSGDVWYQFTATQSAHVISLQNVVNNPNNYYTNANVEIFAGSCSSLTAVGCRPYINNTDVVVGDLTPGATYFVRILGSFTYEFIDFNICILTPPTPPANDGCSSAFVLTPASGSECETITAGTTTNATPSWSGFYEGFNSNDVWYSFTATSPNHILTLNNVVNANYFYGEQINGILYAAPCITQPALYSFIAYYNGQFSFTNLTPGQEYIIRLYANYYSSPVNFDLCLTTPPVPANDLCENASPASLNTSYLCEVNNTGSTQGATSSGGGCENVVSNDVWYQFTAPTATMGIGFTFASSAYNLTAGYEVYTGDCSNLTSVFCQNSFQTNSIISGLTAGETYFIRIFSGANAYIDYNLCLITLPNPPANDECAGAFPVDVNPDLNCTNQFSGTTISATLSMASCVGYTDIVDVWYSFTATGTSQIIDLDVTENLLPGGNPLTSVEIFGGDCNNLQLINCQLLASEHSILVGGLTSGETYYIKVLCFNNSGQNFTMCIRSLPPAPANLGCESAQSIVPASGLTCDVTVSGQTASVPDISYGGCGSSGRALWYSFTATSSYHILSITDITQIYGFSNVQYELYHGTTCNNLQLINCGVYFNEVQMQNLTAGETYYLRISDNSYGAFSFDLCIKTVPVPANDLCENATVLNVSPGEACENLVNGTTAGASSSGMTSCNINSADVWYSFTATQGSHTLQVSNVVVFPYNYYEYFSIEIYKGNCGNPELLQCLSNLTYGTTRIIGDLQAGETYLVRIGSANQLINFDICVSTPPAPPVNDACVNALNIPVAAGTACETIVSGTTLYATVSPPPVNYYNTGNDVWYTFEATAQNHTIHLDNVFAAIGGYYISINGAVYEGTCNSLTAIHYFEAYSGNVVQLSNLTAGNTYFIRMYSNDSYAYANFDICLSTPAPVLNDECVNAAVLYVNTNFSCDSLNYGTFVGATPSQSGCITGPTVDTWHTFLATGTDMRLEFNISPYTNNYTGVEVLEGNCGALNSIYCGQPGQPLVMHNLTPGNSYFVRVYAYANTGINYTVCLFNLPPVPVNDLCENAIEVTPNPGMTCDNYASGSTGGLTESNYLQCYYGTDMWYKFTAINATHVISVNNVNQQFGYTNLSFEVYGNYLCNNYYNVLTCSQAGSIILNGLAPGAEYYIRVVGSAGNGASFDVCIRSIEVPANDECENAVTLTPSLTQECTSYVSGTTVGAITSAGYFGCYPGNNDVWYSFTATALLHNLTIATGNSGFPYGLRIELFENQCGNPVAKYCNVLYSSSNIVLYDLIPGQTYYLRLSSYPSQYADFFDLCITTLPVNLAFYSVENQNGTCALSNNENVYINFYNSSQATIPAGYVTGTLQVSGTNSGSYGPATNEFPIYPFSIGSIKVSGVDLSNAGLTTFTGSFSMPDDNTPGDNSGSNTLDLTLPFTIYPDFDLDGYGDDNNPIVVCAMYYGYTTTPGDCNDYNAAVNPAATEVCNGYDDDCDGEVDETTLDVSLSATVIPCGGTFATLTATASGGAGDYQFSLDSIWSGPVNSWQVTAGTHLVIAYDAYGCGISEYITIAPPNNIVVAPINVTHVSCQGGNSGAVNISVSGGSGVYTYLWSNNKTTQDIVNLAAGTYTVVVTDNQGCTTSVSAVVNPRLSLTATKTNAVCYGSNTGTATAVPVGGTPGYTYLWSNGGTTATISNLSIGNYTVTVTDALGCTRKVTTTISQPQPINIGTAITNAVCYQQPGGSINITVTNAVAPLSYLWSDGATTEDRTAIVGGTYTVTVTDGNGCSQTKVSTVTEPAPITATFNVKNTKCNGGTDGEITATINGGTMYPANNPCNSERYCIQWSNGATSRKITGLTAGVYTVTITDFNGCSLVTSATVTEPAALVITNVATQTLANGKYKVTITATGGTPNYKYKRTPGPTGYQTSNVFNNVPPGSYVFEVSDNNNCTTTTSVELPVFFHAPSGAEDRIGENREEVLGISMLPNPATDVVQILLDTDLDNAEITVFDLQGRQIHRQEFSGTATTIQLDGWSSGMYLVEIRTNGERYVRKLSVVR